MDANKYIQTLISNTDQTKVIPFVTEYISCLYNTPPANVNPKTVSLNCGPFANDTCEFSDKTKLFDTNIDPKICQTDKWTAASNKINVPTDYYQNPSTSSTCTKINQATVPILNSNFTKFFDV